MDRAAGRTITCRRRRCWLLVTRGARAGVPIDCRCRPRRNLRYGQGSGRAGRRRGWHPAASTTRRPRCWQRSSWISSASSLPMIAIGRIPSSRSPPVRTSSVKSRWRQPSPTRGSWRPWRRPRECRPRVGFVLRYAPAMLDAARAGAERSDRNSTVLAGVSSRTGSSSTQRLPFTGRWTAHGPEAAQSSNTGFIRSTSPAGSWATSRASAPRAAPGFPSAPSQTDAGFAPVDVDDATAWLMEFAGGAIGVCHAGWATVGPTTGAGNPRLRHNRRRPLRPVG